MSQKNYNNQVEDPEEVIEAAIEHTESYIQRNSKKLLIGLASVVIIVAAFFGYKYLIAAPREYKASAEMFKAEQMFAVDSFAVALNGGSDFKGFIEIADSYSSTNVGNIANHYAGVCYAKIGDWDNALKSLKKYSPVDGIASEVINAQNSGLQGDVLIEQEKYEEAIKMYEKAIAASSNDFTAPYYIKKAGIVYEKLGNNAKALEFYTKIRNEYPRSYQGRDIEKYIGKVSL